MLAAVYLLILKVGLVGEISFHRQMLIASLAFETLPMEQHLPSHLLMGLEELAVI